MRPFLRVKIIKSYVYFSVILWYPNLQVSSVQFTVVLFKFLIKHLIPQTFTVYQDIAISFLIEFLVEFLTFSGHNGINYCTGGLFLKA